jgi:hypothetical protein
MRLIRLYAGRACFKISMAFAMLGSALLASENGNGPRLRLGP